MALVYNRTKAERALLKTHAASPASLTVDLYAEFWRLNSGPNCLYHTPIAVCMVLPKISFSAKEGLCRLCLRIYELVACLSIFFKSSIL